MSSKPNARGRHAKAIVKSLLKRIGTKTSAIFGKSKPSTERAEPPQPVSTTVAKTNLPKTPSQVTAEVSAPTVSPRHASPSLGVDNSTTSVPDAASVSTNAPRPSRNSSPNCQACTDPAVSIPVSQELPPTSRSKSPSNKSKSPSSKSMSPASSRHLPSGSSGSSNDTFAYREALKAIHRRAPSRRLSPLREMNDPFVFSKKSGGTGIAVDSGVIDQGIVTQADQARGYRLRTPPVLQERQYRGRRLHPNDASDSSGSFQKANEEEQHEDDGIPISPVPRAPMMPLQHAINNVQLCMNDLSGHLNNLFTDAGTHVFNAGVFAHRVAARDETLAPVAQEIAARDVEIERLQDILRYREAELQQIRDRQLHADVDALIQTMPQAQESETSNLYGGDDDNADETDEEETDSLTPALEERILRSQSW